MRSAGCTINDLWDRDIDGSVARTKERPLASGELTVAKAVAFLGLQLSAGLAVLCSLNETSILLGASSLGLVFSCVEEGRAVMRLHGSGGFSLPSTAPFEPPRRSVPPRCIS